MIEIGLIVLGSIGAATAGLRYLHNSPSGTIRKGLAVVILGAGGPGAVPR